MHCAGAAVVWVVTIIGRRSLKQAESREVRSKETT